MSYNNFFLRIIGVGEARFGMIWFMLAILSMLILRCASQKSMANMWTSGLYSKYRRPRQLRFT